jgi:hypothetical protein
MSLVYVVSMFAAAFKYCVMSIIPLSQRDNLPLQVSVGTPQLHNKSQTRTDGIVVDILKRVPPAL